MLSLIFAQQDPQPDWSTIEQGLGGEYRFRGATIASIFNLGIINIIFFVAGATFLFYLITSGLSMMTSRGDPKALEAAKGRATSALVGFVIVFTAFWIAQIIGSLLGVGGFGGILGGMGSVGDGSCSIQCPAGTSCQNGVCVNP